MSMCFFPFAFLDYFPSPTRILHELQLLSFHEQSNFHLNLEQEKEEHQLTFQQHLQQLIPQHKPVLIPPPPLRTTTGMSISGLTGLETVISSSPGTPKIAPPRPPRLKLKTHEQQEQQINMPKLVHKQCVCKVKPNVATKSVACGTENVVKKPQKRRVEEDL
jgi:hypothetical protein